MKWILVGASLFMIGLGSAQAQPPPPTYAPVPPPRYEVVPPPPGPRVVWEPGHWRWDGGRYVWIGGHYVERHHRPMQWVEGRWVWHGRWVWVPAHWR
ncbi:MAG: hypothetical protein B7Z80_11705 [Rhodospirillales bacterium 20-64-7]|nr:MAG: hypothetical protein B7Z80_11705 [Rhodospirillales bacterium 20-64-7]